MHLIFKIILCVMVANVAQAQQIDLLFKQKNYQKIVERGSDWQKLSGQDLFRVSQSHLKLGNDSLAIAYGNHAKNRGYDTWEVDLAQAVAYSNQEQYKSAVKALGKGLQKNDQRKILWLELAGNLYKDKQLDSAKATYHEISKMWQGDALSNFMVCQISMEIKPSQTCIECFRNRLYIFPKDGQFHQEALEKIAKMEHFVTKAFSDAEKTYNQLIATYPNQKDYLVLKLQLMWFQNRTEDALALERELEEAWYAQQMSSSHYKRGKLLIDSFADDINRIEVYKNPSRKLGDKSRYDIFVLSTEASRPLGKIAVFDTDSGYSFQGYGFEEGAITLESKNYLEVKKLIISRLNTSEEKMNP
jgi:tetratricopeptide (TPR) repeat protein